MKKQTTKRVLSMLLAFVMIFVMMPAVELPAVAETGGGMCGEDLTWSFDSKTGTLTVSGTGEMEYYSSFDDTPWASYKSSIKTIIIEDGVTSIAAYAFATTTCFSVIIADSVTLIQSMAFGRCTGLTRVTFGENSQLTAIYSEAFSCNRLEKIDIPDSVTYLSSTAFWDCEKIIQKENGVSYVDNWAVDYDGSIAFVELRSDTVGIAAQAFWFADTLLGISFGENSQLKYINGGAFKCCDNLGSILLPASLTEIHNEAFWGCDFRTVSFEENSQLKSIGDQAFMQCSLEVVDFGRNSQLKSIGREAFYRCSQLRIITLPDTITHIGYGAFHGTNNLIREIEGGVYYLGKCAVSGNSPSITLRSDTVCVADYAFYRGEAITSVYIPDSVTHIGVLAFGECSNLTNVTFGENSKLEDIGGGAFTECGFSEIDIPDGVTGIGEGAFNDCVNLKNVTIPDGVRTIGGGTFYGCVSLESIVFFETGKLESITGDGVFYNCVSLKELALPNSVTYIDPWSFNGARHLENVLFLSGSANSKYKSVGNCLIDTTTQTLVVGFDNSQIPDDGSIKHIGNYSFMLCENLTSITIPDGVISIGECAFSGCTSLAKLNIPASVTSIGSAACAECTSLYTLFYCGTEEQGALITVGGNWGYGVPAPLKFHNYENSICTACGNTCPHKKIVDYSYCDACGWICSHEYTSDGSCEICGRPCDHLKYTAEGFCETCGCPCEHIKYTDEGFCEDCGQSCPHEYFDYYFCYDCGWECPHESRDAVGWCTRCGWICEHMINLEIMSDGLCEICGFACNHEITQEGLCSRCPFYCMDYEKHQTLDDAPCDRCGWQCIHNMSPEIFIVDGVCTLCHFGEASSETIPGDVDGDGDVTNADVLKMYRYIYNSETYPLDVTVGDVDKDGYVTNADILAIYRYIYNPELYPIG